MRLLYILLLVGLSLNLNSQNLEFSYSVDNSNVTTSDVSIFVENTSGSDEILTSFTVVMYYEDGEAGITSSDFDISELTSLGWNVDASSFNNISGTNGSIPAEFDIRFQHNIIDNNGVGSTITSGGGPVHLVTYTFDLSPGTSDGGDAYLVNQTEQPGIVYTNENFDEFAIAVGGIQQQALPIELKTFTVSKYNKDDALLEWTSSTERNSSHFEVERSLDNESWERLTYVEAAGDSNEEKEYSYVDYDLPVNRNQTVFYYRLKMVDRDAEFTYSEVRKLSYNLPNQYVEIQVYPNPVQNEILVSTLSSADDEAIESVLLFDVDGRLMLEREISANGINRINVADLPASSYYLHVNVGGETKIEKIIKID